jgi:CO/xanthine dehydrogenase Mo-binding subunit
MATGLARRVSAFCSFRFLLGLAESVNYPAGVKVAAEWFPPKELATAVGIFQSGSSVGAMIAPALAAWLILQFGWKAARAPSGRGVGVSCAIYLGTYVATMAEVAVNKATGAVQVKRVVCAQDQGVIVSPDGSRQQIEGSITMGLGYALTEEVHFKNGEVLDRNFDTYQIPRFSWLPQIETVLVENPAVAASGCGEPPIVNMGAVLANAIYDATGARLRQLPMTPARILEALKRA